MSATANHDEGYSSSRSSSETDKYLERLNAVRLRQDVETRLGVLVRVADVLGIDDVSISSYANAITNLSTLKYTLNSSLHRAAFVEEELRAHIAKVEFEVGLIRRWSSHFSESESFDSLEAVDTTESLESINHQRTSILIKAKEYHKQLDILTQQAQAQAQQESVTITELTEQQTHNREIEKEIKRKRAEVKVFGGVPSNLDLARTELRKARDEQMRLIRIREELLVGMAGGVS